MPLQISTQSFSSLLGGSPINILGNDSTRVFIIIATVYTAGANSPILCLEAAGTPDSAILFLADGSNNILRQRQLGELVHSEMYISEIPAGSPAGLFMVTTGSET